MPFEDGVTMKQFVATFSNSSTVSRAELFKGAYVSKLYRPDRLGGGLGVSKMSIGNASLRPLTPHTGPFYSPRCDSSDLQLCIEAVSAAAARAPNVPMPANPKVETSYRLEITKNGAFAAHGTAGGKLIGTA